MFTGIIQAVGHIEAITAVGEDIKLHIHAASLGLDDVKLGDSIAVNGVCLTATRIIETNSIKTHFEAHVSTETLNVTTGLNQLQAVNLEKALRLNDRLGGHLVSGHVDGIGTVVTFTDLGDCWKLTIEAPRALSKYIAKKGSICVNGVSLTVNSVEKNIFTMNIIPHTLQHTTFNQLTASSQVNLEIDQIARYVERMTEWSNNQVED
ncbi:MAG: riboflavin synthase [Proteobacteria bacterium ST_bin12]|nr:MAG: riboflavin synthase [Proteobacteria bacterium ST_bin12]